MKNQNKKHLKDLALFDLSDTRNQNNGQNEDKKAEEIQQETADNSLVHASLVKNT